jgi:hypothetical protein
MDTHVEVSAAVDGDAEPNSSAKRAMRQEDRMAESAQLTMFGRFTVGDALFHNPPYRTASRSTAIIGFFFLTGPCAAQMTTRGVSGTVTDGHNEPLRGAVIQKERRDNRRNLLYHRARWPLHVQTPGRSNRPSALGPF